MVDIVQNADGSMNLQAPGGTNVGEFGRRPQYALNVLRLAANVADTETVTIGGTVFEFDRSANGVVAGAIAVTGHADDTPANASTALVTAINATASCPMSALKISANEILLTSKTYGNQVHACTETLAGANNAFSAAAAYGGVAAGNNRVFRAARVPTATEVALGNLHFPLPFVPTAVLVQVRVTSTGVVKAWDGATTIDSTNSKVTLDNAGATDWAATDTVHIIGIE